MKQEQALKDKDNDFTSLQAEYYKITGVDFLNPFAVPPVNDLNIPTVSVVIPAGNVETSILPCLVSIEQSSFNQHYANRLQVIVVSDGSTDSTWEILSKLNLSLNLIIVRQDHSGQPQALNTGISLATNEIIISCDADMVLSYYAIEHFASIHKYFPNVVLAGFRSNAFSNDPRVNAEQIARNGVHRYSEFYHDERIDFHVPGWPSNMCLESSDYKNLGFKKGLWMRAEDPWLLPDLVFGALFSLPRSVYKEIGGYDERFKGWGCTDGYLASKAVSMGNYVIPVYAASGLHIAHPDRSKNKKNEYERNRALFKKLILETDIDDFPNWLKESSKRIKEMHSYNKTPETPKREESLNKKPDFFDSDSLIAIGKFSEAIDVLPDQKSDESLMRIGKCLNGLGRHRDAIEALLKISNETGDSQIELILAHASSGEFTFANKILKESSNEKIRSYFDDESKYVEKGDFFLNEKFFEAALKSYQIALVINPDNKLAFSKLSKI